MSTETAAGSVSAFLSHSYSASAVNLFFYDFACHRTTIAFKVDRGTVRTSTTRLERMIRDADAFIGVWPFSQPFDRSTSQEELRAEAQYFRLELDMAVRAGKPIMVFSDRRYGHILKAPARATQLRYDAQEVQLASAAPSWPHFQTQSEAFWNAVTANRPPRRYVEEGRVGVLVPRYADVDAAAVVAESVRKIGGEPVTLPTRLNLTGQREIERCDWVVAEVGDPAIEALSAYLHGRSIPLLRLRRASAGPSPSIVEETILGSHPVGYREDTTAWATDVDLQTALSERLSVISQESELIGDRHAAVRYFQSAAKQKAAVFLSYSGADAGTAAKFAVELRNNFQDVFDYQDGHSIPGGVQWLDEIISRASSTPLGVILFSAAYWESPYCREEALRLYDGFINSKVALLAVNLDQSTPPELLKHLQYQSVNASSPADIVKAFIERL